MPSITESELKKKIKAGEISNVYLLFGEEKYLVKHYTNLLTKSIVNPDFADFNMHIYDGKGFDFNELFNASEALPMMSEYTCLVIKDLPCDNMSSDLLENMITLVSDLPESTVLIITLLTIPDKLKTAKGKKLLTAINNAGCSVDFARMSVNQLCSQVEKGAKKRGCEIGFNEAGYLIRLVGDDMQVVQNELEKLCAYCRNSKITKEDIDAVAVKSLQARVFDLTKYLLAGNCDMALKVLDTLMVLKEEPINILGAMMTSYIDMYRVKVYVSGGMRPEDAAKDFNYRNKEFRLTNAAKNASKFSMTQLRKFIEIFNDADTLLKSTSVSGRLVIEQTITKLLLAANGEEV